MFKLLFAWHAGHPPPQAGNFALDYQIVQQVKRRQVSYLPLESAIPADSWPESQATGWKILASLALITLMLPNAKCRSQSLFSQLAPGLILRPKVSLLVCCGTTKKLTVGLTIW